MHLFCKFFLDCFIFLPVFMNLHVKLHEKMTNTKQGLLKNWPRVTGPKVHGVFKVIS